MPLHTRRIEGGECAEEDTCTLVTPRVVASNDCWRSSPRFPCWSRPAAERHRLAGAAQPSASAGSSGPPLPSRRHRPKTLELAYISFAVANSYDAPMLAAAKAAATAGNANLTVFDGNLDPATQTKQLQDAIASGKYDGIVLQPVYGPALVPGAQEAIKAGIAIGNIDQILGPDNTTAESQVEGQLVNVVFVPSELGRKIGELVVTACADANPCNVGYIWSVKAAALDATLKEAFDKATSVNPNIKIVAEGESFYTTPLGLKAAQDMLVAHPDITVITGADQAITGAVTGGRRRRV